MGNSIDNRTLKERLTFHSFNKLGSQEPPPIHAKNDKIPVLPQWQAHRWILVYYFYPLAIHQLGIFLLGRPLPFSLVAVLYSIVYSINGIFVFQATDKMGRLYGYLDGDKHDRDKIPETNHFPWYIQIPTAISRPMMLLFLTYHNDPAPLTVFRNYWILLEIGLYPIILDFFFYWYHRSMHEVDFLWPHHRLHHTIKHPNAMLAIYADYEQVVFDVVIIPFATWYTMRCMGLPMGFYDWWFCQAYVSFVELLGHSGLRIWATPPSTLSWLLRYFDMELMIEDHDMHHRRGWKKASNYGKQTRVWDRIFGTCGERIECLPENMDREHTAIIPLY